MIDVKIGQYVVSARRYSDHMHVSRADSVGAKQIRTMERGYGWSQTKREDVLAVFDNEADADALCAKFDDIIAPFKRERVKVIEEYYAAKRDIDVRLGAERDIDVRLGAERDRILTEYGFGPKETTND